MAVVERLMSDPISAVGTGGGGGSELTNCESEREMKRKGGGKRAWHGMAIHARKFFGVLGWMLGLGRGRLHCCCGGPVFFGHCGRLLVDIYGGARM